jgi:hypothetical protein
MFRSKPLALGMKRTFLCPLVVWTEIADRPRSRTSKMLRQPSSAVSDGCMGFGVLGTNRQRAFRRFECLPQGRREIGVVVSRCVLEYLNLGLAQSQVSVEIVRVASNQIAGVIYDLGN